MSADRQIGTRPEKRGRGQGVATRDLVEVARRLLDASRWPMTLRQLYYQIVSAADRGEIAFPKNHQSYKRLSRALVAAREDGTIPWSWLVDGVRATFRPRTFGSAADLLAAAHRTYRADLMRHQDVVIQVWTESASMGAVIAHVTDPYCIPVFPARGYSGRGYFWDAATDAAAAHADGRRVVILHLGDYDPSGEDILRDAEQTLRPYVLAADPDSRLTVAEYRRYVDPDQIADLTDWLTVERIALTPDQIEAYGLPYRPVKLSDSRSAGFAGKGAVELEALPVDDLLGIVEDAIESYIDPTALATARLAEESEREIMARISRTPVERLLQVAS